MHDDASHPLLQQVPLTVNPFVDLPKPPTLPHNYASLPSTLPPSVLQSAPAASAPDKPGYITSATGSFAAHPSTIVAQNTALLSQLSTQRTDAEQKVKAWEAGIQERELIEKRRKAPGYLDSDVKVLEPVKAELQQPKEKEAHSTLMDEPEAKVDKEKRRVVAEDLGSAMDRAFGRGEMGLPGNGPPRE